LPDNSNKENKNKDNEDDNEDNKKVGKENSNKLLDKKNNIKND